MAAIGQERCVACSAMLHFQSAPPARSLHATVVGYGESSWEPGVTRAEVPFTPRGCPALIVVLSGTLRCGWLDVPDTHEPMPHAFLLGQVTRAVLNRFAGRFRVFFVTLRPTAPLALLGHAIGDITDDEVPPEIDALSLPALREWVERLREAPDFAARVALTDRALLGLQQRVVATPRAVPLARAAVQQISEAGGALRVARLADRLGVTERTLQRHVQEAVGMPAKTFAQITRYNRVAIELNRRPGVDWQDLVVRYGYADQSHLGREFRRFAGMSPSAYRAALNPIDRQVAELGA